MKGTVLALLSGLAVSGAFAQGSIPGLTSTPINFAEHADAFAAGPDGNV